MNPAEMEKKLAEMSEQVAKLTKDNERLTSGQGAPKIYNTRRPQKFWTTQDRFVHGKYVRATPEYPAVVVFDDNVKIPVDAKGKPEDQSLIPFADKAPEPPKTERLIKPYADLRNAPEAHTDAGEGRPSDRDPAGR